MTENDKEKATKKKKTKKKVTKKKVTKKKVTKKRKTKTEDTEEKKDEDEDDEKLNDDVRIALLSNYYQEVTSHSVNILATTVATFVLIQIYFEIKVFLPVDNLPTLFLRYLIWGTIGAFSGFTVYLGGRTLYWSILTTTILTARHHYDTETARNEGQTRLSYLQNKAIEKGTKGTPWWRLLFALFAFRTKTEEPRKLGALYPAAGGVIFVFLYCFWINSLFYHLIFVIAGIIIAIILFIVALKERLKNKT